MLNMEKKGRNEYDKWLDGSSKLKMSTNNENISNKDDLIKEMISEQKLGTGKFCDLCKKEIGLLGLCSFKCPNWDERKKTMFRTTYDCVLCDDFNDNEDKSALRKHMITQHYYGDLVDWVIHAIIEDDDFPE